MVRPGSGGGGTTVDAVTAPDAPHAVPAPPETGHALVDDAVARVGDLSGVPVEQHHDLLQAAQQVLSDVLANSREHLQATIPGVPGPRG